MSNTFFLATNLIGLLVVLCILISTIENYWKHINKLRLGICAFIVFGLMCLPFSTRNWEYQANVERQKLHDSGISFIENYIPYNTPVISKKIIIDDGADFRYYELLED